MRSRGDRVSFTVRPRGLVVAGSLLLLIAACFLVSLALGKYTVAVPDVIAALAGTGSEQVRLVVVDWRLPRALLSALFGAALGLSGAIFQSLTRNALGSPDVIGFNMGSYSGVLVVMLAGGSGFLLIASGAVIGGLVTAFLVYLFAYKRGVQGFRLIIIGIALSAMLGSLNTWIMVKADVAFAMQAAVWGAGTLNGVTWVEVWPSIALFVVFAVALAVLAPGIRQLELGDENAKLQGLKVERSKVRMIVLGVGFTALVTAAAGPISFIALAAPQLARRLTRAGASIDLVASALVGAALLSIADLIAQHALPGVSLPVGAVTVSIGGLYLVWLLARETKTR
ncbi:iron-enterobactin ABC transporter permease [Pseudoclavibacter sp. AY1F1]|nr:iron-enterobactin ABC transporter permease [Pseudoclavibacter sp. AY1F1]